MEREIILRPAAPEHIKEILAVQGEAEGAAPWSAADYASLLGAEGTVFLVAQDAILERLGGFILGRAIAGEMEILNLAVAPSYRRQGLARRLVAAALARGQAQGAVHCWLEVRESNGVARAFYRALGFVERGRRPRYYRDPVEDAVMYERSVLAAGPAP
ncbi:MAG: ribosomal protein S18-alanine N-acetyltransferase [Acidobacteria bacterium]|nr:ribosomal protein S18-alanine N-acetyltransferase [Acidobacteriota bacterium]